MKVNRHIMTHEPDLGKELAIANETIRRLQKQIRGYKGLMARSEPPKGPDNLLNPSTTGTGAQETPKTVSPDHWVGAWQHYCAECGGVNPDFKDETICQDCGMHLGAKPVAEKLKACPNCGGTKAKELKKA